MRGADHSRREAWPAEAQLIVRGAGSRVVRTLSALERRVLAGAEALLLEPDVTPASPLRLRLACLYVLFRSATLAHLVRRGFVVPASSWKVFTAVVLRPGDVAVDLGRRHDDAVCVHPDHHMDVLETLERIQVRARGGSRPGCCR